MLFAADFEVVLLCQQVADLLFGLKEGFLGLLKQGAKFVTVLLETLFILFALGKLLLDEVLLGELLA